MFPDYDSPAFQRDNPCHDLFMDCEGDCAGCPNKQFFRDFDLKQESLYAALGGTSVLPVPQEK